MDRYTDALRDRVEKRPYQALALAAGVGFVLGSGLWKHLARSLVAVGGRLAVSAAVPLLVDFLRPLAEPDMLDGATHFEKNHRRS